MELAAKLDAGAHRVDRQALRAADWAARGRPVALRGGRVAGNGRQPGRLDHLERKQPIALIGREMPMSLRTLITSAPGFSAARTYEFAATMTDLIPAVVIVISARPSEDVGVLADRFRPCPPILVISTNREEATVVDTVRSGATSYLVDGEYTRGDLLNALAGITSGESTMSPSVVGALVRRLHASPPRDVTDARDELLTERDAELLDLLAEGHTNQEIANRLFLAEKTVRNYISRLYARLEFASRAETIVWWISRNRD